VLPGAAVSTTTFDAGNRLTKWGPQTLSYDANGNLLSDGSITYTWDERDRLVKMVVTGSVYVPTFKYDSLGRRTSKTVSGVQTGYLYDGINIVQEKSGSTVTANLLTGLAPDEWYARELSSNIRYPLTDALGSAVALTDTTQTIKTSYGYDAYGGTVRTGAADTNSQQYTGRENDGGLYYYRARYYSPKFGRFISEDPIGWESGQTNGYAYAGGGPLDATDPSGLAVFKAVKWIIQAGKRIGWVPTSTIAAKTAVKYRRAGKEICALGRDAESAAKKVETTANGTKDLLHHPKDAHKLSGNQPHFQTNGVKGHAFYKVASAVAVTTYLGDGFLGQALDFINPLSLGKDILDIYDEFSGGDGDVGGSGGDACACE
jgi:RHS repeat-associated protein